MISHYHFKFEFGGVLRGDRFEVKYLELKIAQDI